MTLRRTLSGVLAAALLIADAAAQTYPSRPIRLIIPGAAGGPTDVPARIVADALSNLVGQRFLPENRIGAGGIVAGEAVAKAEPNGYTLLYGNSSLFAINQAIYKSMPYDPAKAFVMVGMATNSPQLLVASLKFGPKTVRELVDYGKANPGKINFASGGPGSLPHLTLELFKLTTGVDVLHVPFSGGGPAATALIGGQADLLFDLIRTRIRSGELRAIALAGPMRDPDLPDVPTFAESGYPELTSTSWTGIAAPAGTPPEIVSFLNGKLNEVVAQPDFRAKARGIGLVPQGGSPADFAAWADRERAKWARVVKETGATVQ